MIKLKFTKLKLIQRDDTIDVKCLRVINKAVDVVTFEVDLSSRFAHLATVEYRGTAISVSASLHKGSIQNVFIQYTQGTTIKCTYFSGKGESLKYLSSFINTYIERSFGA